MRLYLAGAEGDIDTIERLLPLKPRVLLSYWYILNGKAWDCVEYCNKNNVPIFLDSGAYSAMTSNAKLKVNEYIDFCLKEKDRFDVIASLDVIMDWKATEKNHLTMKSAGVVSIPCFHVAEPFDFLKKLTEGNDYIALGVAGNQRRNKAVMQWLIKCHSILKGKKVHGFGLTGFTVMKSFNWFSVDSTTWHVGSRFGHVLDINTLSQKKDHTGKSAKQLNEYNAKVLLMWIKRLNEQRRNANSTQG
jgi:hypothetical protein